MAARVFDKARAARDGTIYDYIYPCPMDRGVFDRWGITARAFEAALDNVSRPTTEIAAPGSRRACPMPAATTPTAGWSNEKSASLDRQDAEEGVAVA
jgi:hypothetical protein